MSNYGLRLAYIALEWRPTWCPTKFYILNILYTRYIPINIYICLICKLNVHSICKNKIAQTYRKMELTLPHL